MIIKFDLLFIYLKKIIPILIKSKLIMTRRVIINTIATFDGSVIATVEALKNIKNIRIVLRK